MNKIILALILLLSPFIYASSTSEKIGDAFRIILPLSAYGTTLYLDDNKGQMEFYKSFGTTVAITYALKYGVKKERPNGEDTRSFPSGHASSTFASATFIHIKYGLKYAWLPYLASTYTAYSRVQAREHYTIDVISGAAIGIVSSWFFTSEYKG